MNIKIAGSPRKADPQSCPVTAAICGGQLDTHTCEVKSLHEIRRISSQSLKTNLSTIVYAYRGGSNTAFNKAHGEAISGHP